MGNVKGITATLLIFALTASTTGEFQIQAAKCEWSVTPAAMLVLASMHSLDKQERSTKSMPLIHTQHSKMLCQMSANTTSSTIRKAWLNLQHPPTKICRKSKMARARVDINSKRAIKTLVLPQKLFYLMQI